ncbi:MarR family winged helix-turn-helix transcriptional regulator [Marinicellulosiphila megalodicopiae]|uniref:MarR family winged helix-turn-helix transcriptional regulator n=1 Tax=Marinicellulosiphila megalodicopiae TaxID=2724896 RepID=UPI003BB14B4B
MFETCLYFNLNRTTRLINKIWDDAFKQHSISPSHGYLLLAIHHDSSQLTANNLKDILQLEISTITRFIDVLEKNKWVKRITSPSDKRSKFISLTASGQRFAIELDKTAKQLFKTARKKINPETVEQCVTLCHKISEELSV